MDVFADRILGRARGNVTTSSTGGAMPTPTPQAGGNLRWVDNGVVQYAFIWGKHSLDDENAIFV